MKKVKLTLYKKNGKKVYYQATDKIKRLIYRTSLGDFLKCHIYVSYGKKLDVNNNLVTFYNDVYATPENAKQMLLYFWNEN